MDQGQIDDGGALGAGPLWRVLRVARQLGETSELSEILPIIIDAMRDALDSERATVFVHDAKSHQLFTLIGHGVGADGAARSNEIRIPDDQGIAGECLQSREVLKIADAYAHPSFRRDVDQETGFRTRSILAVPVIASDGEVAGVAQVLNRRHGEYTDADVEIAQALAAQAAVAIRRTQLFKDRLVREKLERDLELARSIQQRTFPAEFPKIEGYEIAGWSEPADQTGGDAFDVIGLAHEDGRISLAPPGDFCTQAALFMADATGHGVGPALSVTQLRSMIRMALRMGAPMSQLLSHLNNQMCSDLLRGRFVTAWLGTLDATSHTLSTFSAGQGPLLQYNCAADAFNKLDADALPFGILEDAIAGEMTNVPLAPGDMYLVLSDGIFEAMSVEGEQFGVARTQRLVHAHRHRSAQEIIDALRSAVDGFTGYQPPDDDKTALLIRRQPEA